MRPHPRIRKTVKWGGAVVSVILLVAWVGSGWYSAGWRSKNRFRIGVHGGVAIFGPKPIWEWPDGESAGWLIRNSSQLRWKVEWWSHAPVWECTVPLWLPAAISLTPTAAAWRLDTLARRRARVGLCFKCSYNRTGLAPGAVCPECGAAAIVTASAVS